MLMKIHNPLNNTFKYETVADYYILSSPFFESLNVYVKSFYYRVQQRHQMSVETIKLSPTLYTIGCHRRRLAFQNDKLYYTNGKSLFDNEDKEIIQQKSQIFDLLNINGTFYTIDAKGEVCSSNPSIKPNSISGNSGIFAALQNTKSFIIAAHDLSHTIRVLDPETLNTIRTIQTPGIPNSLSSFPGEDIFVFTDDRTINVVDLKMDKIERSSVLSAEPVAIYCNDQTIIVACDDRRIRLYDSKRLKTPTMTTKPASKNGTAALWTENGKEIVAVGFDEGMTLVEPSNDIGQFKRCKYLSESPFISMPVETPDGFAVLTRGGTIHKITNPVKFLRSQKETSPEDDDE